MDKDTIIINLLMLIPAIAKGVEGAIATYEKFIDMLKNGSTPEELAAAVTERDAVLMRIVEKTGG